MIVQLTDKAWAVKPIHDNTCDFSIEKNWLFYTFNSPKDFLGIREGKIELPAGQWTALGFSNEITEDQAAKVVKTSAYKGFDGKIDESTRKYIAYGERPDIRYNTALESLQSLLQSKECYDKNPYGDSKDDLTDNNGRYYDSNQTYEGWERLQERVGRWFIILNAKTT